MAEAVKNSGRPRRPPSHLRPEYNEDNYDPMGTNQNKNKDTHLQGSDPCSFPMMARLLSKFISSANKKLHQSHALKAQEEAAMIKDKKVNDNQLRSCSKPERPRRQDKSNLGVKNQPNHESANGSKFKHSTDIHGKAGQIKTLRNTQKQNQSLTKNSLIPDNFHSIESMAKVSREQLMKLNSKGIDHVQVKKNTKEESLSQKKQSKNAEFIGKIYSGNLNKWRSDSKLFKRAAFHIGIAYNIHIDKVKKNNPNYTTEDLDPTLVSRRMKMQTMEQQKKRAEEAERIKISLMLQAQKRAQQSKALKQSLRLIGGLQNSKFIEKESELNKNQIAKFILSEDVNHNQCERLKETNDNVIQAQNEAIQFIQPFDNNKAHQQNHDAPPNGDFNWNKNGNSSTQKPLIEQP